MSRTWLAVAAVLGGLGVLMGAFGAHALSPWLEGVSDGARRLQWWHTAANYHLAHALALGLCAVARGQDGSGRVAAWAFALGTALFSGSLYLMTLTGVRWLGAITPVGGLSLVLGWFALARSVLRGRDRR